MEQLKLLERLSLRQPSAEETFKNSQRRARRVQHGVNRKMKCLLQRVLPAHGCMRYLIGEYDPSTPGGKFISPLGRFRLVSQVRLHAVVQTEHVMIISTASTLRDAK